MSRCILPSTGLERQLWLQRSSVFYNWHKFERSLWDIQGGVLDVTLGNSESKNTSISHMFKFLYHYKDVVSESIIQLTHVNLLFAVSWEGFQIIRLDDLVSIFWSSLDSLSLQCMAATESVVFSNSCQFLRTDGTLTFSISTYPYGDSGVLFSIFLRVNWHSLSFVGKCRAVGNEQTFLVSRFRLS